MRLFLKILKGGFCLIFCYIMLFSLNFLFVFTDRFITETKNSEEFAVYPDGVEIEGTDRISRDELLIITGLDRRRSYFELSERRLELFIYANRWVRRCAVKKMFPNRIKILIEEYKPAMIINGSEKANSGKNAYSLWFADSDGLVFKKAYPREADGSLPFFYIDSETVEGADRRMRIKRAIAIVKEWKKGKPECRVNRIYYDILNHYSMDCEVGGKRVSRVYLGAVPNDDDLGSKRKIFFNTLHKLQKKKMYAGEFHFDGEGDHRRVVLGRLVYGR